MRSEKRMTDKKIIIIGAGLAGLSAGCYAQMNGFPTQIFEMHNLPGGQCTSWKRRGFVFDGCIHHLAGCKSDSSLYAMWQELGVFPGRLVIFPEHICRVEDQTGKSFDVYRDLDRLSQHMLELFPQDSETIRRYVKNAMKFAEYDMLDTPLLEGTDFAARFLKLLTLMKWRISMKTYSCKFKNPFLRKVFPSILYDSPDTPMLAHLNIMGNSHNLNYGVPVGGSLEFSRAIEKRYRDLGGTIIYNSRVDKVVVENNCAVGVRLADGTEHQSNIVISDVFAPTVIFNLLNGQYAGDRIKRQFSKPLDNRNMGLQVSFGVARDLAKEPRALVLFLEKPVKIADREHDRLGVELFGYDASMAPFGKSVLKVLLSTSYLFWKELRKQPDKYREEKQRVSARVLQVLEKRFPGIGEQVEVVDVATPMTVERYTGVSQGYENAMSIGAMINILKGRPRILHGLAGFFMIGESAGVAGIPGCAATGRNVVKTICKKEGSSFSSHP